MIRTVADLLEAFCLKEVEILDKQNLKHAPTIGRMYEGLTQEILQKALPANSKLRVVSGFVESEDGELSRQIDCMLVSGEGTQIPYTTDFKYPLSQVVATIEVKKNLFTDELDNAYRNLLSVKELSLKGLKDKFTARQQFRDAYYSLIGEDPSSYEDFNGIPVWKKQIGLVLNAESLIPIRMVIGYHGFASENGFRNAFINFLNKKIGHNGYGPISLPNLITCGDYSLVKLNFMPYGIRINNRQSLYSLFGLKIDESNAPVNGENMWPLYASYPENPLLLLLELIWTRIEYNQQLNISGYDLGVEVPRPLVLAKAIQRGNVVGWHYEYFPLSDEQLTNLPTLLHWKPIEITEEQSVIILNLISDENSVSDGLDIHDPELFELFDSNKDQLSNVIQSVVEMGIAILDGPRLKLLTRYLKVATLPNGKIVAGDDNEGMFTKWLSSQNFS